MTLPVLVGPAVRLEPVPRDVAAAVVRGEVPPRAGPGWPHDDTADGLRPYVEHGAPDGGWLVVIDGLVVGEVGWRGGPDPDGDVELGYGLAAPARGRGLGTEAVGLVAAWAEQQPGVRRLVAEVLVGNEPSLRLLQRLGFRVHEPRPPYLRLVRPAPGVVQGRHVC